MAESMTYTIAFRKCIVVLWDNLYWGVQYILKRNDYFIERINNQVRVSEETRGDKCCLFATSCTILHLVLFSDSLAKWLSLPIHALNRQTKLVWSFAIIVTAEDRSLGESLELYKYGRVVRALHINGREDRTLGRTPAECGVHSFASRSNNIGRG